MSIIAAIITKVIKAQTILKTHFNHFFISFLLNHFYIPTINKIIAMIANVIDSIEVTIKNPSKKSVLSYLKQKCFTMAIMLAKTVIMPEQIKDLIQYISPPS